MKNLAILPFLIFFYESLTQCNYKVLPFEDGSKMIQLISNERLVQAFTIDNERTVSIDGAFYMNTIKSQRKHTFINIYRIDTLSCKIRYKRIVKVKIKKNYNLMFNISNETELVKVTLKKGNISIVKHIHLKDLNTRHVINLFEDESSVKIKKDLFLAGFELFRLFYKKTVIK